MIWVFDFYSSIIRVFARLELAEEITGADL